MTLSAELRRVFIRIFLLPSWVLLFVAALAFIAGAEVTGWVLYVPFALSLVLFGLPHGAVDHLVPGRLVGAGASVGSIVGVFVLYLALATFYLMVWVAAPGLAFAFFIALTWFHWGQGDLYFLTALGHDGGSEPLLLKVLTVFVRGGMPILVPLLAFPEVYSSVARSIVGLFRGDMSGMEWVFSPVFRGAAGVGFFVVVLTVLCWGYRRPARCARVPWRLEAAETLLLTAYFAIVPPILALGLYYCLWHSPRHVARLMVLNRTSSTALEKGRARAAFGAFVRDATPLTLAALALLAGLYFYVPGRIEDAAGLLAVYLVLISTLTLPHVVIVYLMDLRQGIWR